MQKTNTCNINICDVKHAVHFGYGCNGFSQQCYSQHQFITEIPSSSCSTQFIYGLYLSNSLHNIRSVGIYLPLTATENGYMWHMKALIPIVI